MDTKMELTEKQQKAVEQYKEAVKDELPAEYDDFYVLRWLRAREFNVRKAEKMFRANLEWRRQNDIDNIEEWDQPEVFKKYFPGGLFGYDKEGLPIYYDLLPTMDLKGLIRSAKKGDIMKMQAYKLEMVEKEIRKQSRKLGKKLNNATFIVDLKPLNRTILQKDVLDVMMAIGEMIEANYPEIVNRILMIHVPKIFTVLYAICKPMLSDHTKRKVNMLGNNWKETLLEIIDADQLPVVYGGTQTGPGGDINCSHKIRIVMEIPSEYYLRGSAALENKHTNKITVGFNSTEQFELDVAVPGSNIIWSFETKEYDIAYGLYLKTSDSKKLSDMKQLVKITKVNSHLVPEDGLYTCKAPGKYIFVLDNNHFHRNEVEYNLEVLESPQKDQYSDDATDDGE